MAANRLIERARYEAWTRSSLPEGRFAREFFGRVGVTVGITAVAAGPANDALKGTELGNIFEANSKLDQTMQNYWDKEHPYIGGMRRAETWAEYILLLGWAAQAGDSIWEWMKAKGFVSPEGGRVYEGEFGAMMP